MTFLTSDSLNNAIIALQILLFERPTERFVVESNVLGWLKEILNIGACYLDELINTEDPTSTQLSSCNRIIDSLPLCLSIKKDNDIKFPA